MSDISHQMNIRGKIVELCEEGLATFKVQTRLGYGYVWVWEEVSIDFRVGMELNLEEAPITFSDGYPIAIIKPGTSFLLDGIMYEVRDPERRVL